MAQKNLKDKIIAALERKIATTVNRKPGNAEYRKAATQKHLNMFQAHAAPIYTMNNVYTLYDEKGLKMNTSEGKPFATVEDVVMKETDMPTQSMRPAPPKNVYKSIYYPVKSPKRSITRSIQRRPFGSIRRRPFDSIRRRPFGSIGSIPKRSPWRKVRPNSPWPRTRKNSYKPIPKPALIVPNRTQKKKDYKKQIIAKLVKEQKKGDKKALQLHIDAIRKYPGHIQSKTNVDAIYQLARLPKDKPYKMIVDAFRKKETRQKKKDAHIFQPSSFVNTF